MSSYIYSGRVFVLSATTTESLSSTFDDNGFGEYEDEGRNYTEYGYTNFLIGDTTGIIEAGCWGSCTRTDNGELNWKDCDTSAEKTNRIGYFMNSLKVGLVRYYNYDNDQYPNASRDAYLAFSGRIYVQVFVI